MRVWAKYVFLYKELPINQEFEEEKEEEEKFEDEGSGLRVRRRRRPIQANLKQ